MTSVSHREVALDDGGGGVPGSSSSSRSRVPLAAIATCHKRWVVPQLDNAVLQSVTEITANILAELPSHRSQREVV